jgi:hypothetical protein
MTEAQQFSTEEKRLFRRILGAMIPALPDEGLPGADDEEIFGRLLEKAAGREERLRADLDDLVAGEGGVNQLLSLESSDFADWFEGCTSRWPEESHPFFRRLAPLLAQAYYEDSRVQQAHGRRPGAPFPEGYVVIQGDWSLLDKVRGRSPLYRR